MVSRFNPAGLVDLAEQTVRAYINAASWGERQFFGLIRSGMNGSSAAAPELLQFDADPAERAGDDADSLDAKMHGLLDRAVGQNTAASAEYEAILRPVFKDDEMLMVMVGAVLGFLVGELQVVLVEQFAR